MIKSPQWRPIPSHPHYEVNEEGDVLLQSGHFLRPHISFGYWRYELWKDGKRSFLMAHMLVLRAFVGPCPPGKETAHWDGDRRNCHLSNLRYATFKENYDDKVRHGRVCFGEDHHSAKLTVDKVRTIRANSGVESVGVMARRYGVNVSSIQKVIDRKTWKHVAGLRG